MAYDEKFRQKAVEYKDNGHSFKQLKKVFGISHTAYYEWKKNKEDTGFYVAPKTQKTTRKRKVDPEKLKEIINENPDLFLWEIAEKFNCSAVAVHKRCEKLNITFKKRRSRIQKNQNKQGQSISKR